MNTIRQPWLADAKKETWLILAPALLPVVIVLLFQDYFVRTEVNTFWWIVLVLGVDVSHVYSTLFRLYWDKQTFQTYRTTLLIIPAVAIILGFSLHVVSPILFWRTLAYVAVFHFIRQQYGFMRLYSRHENYGKVARYIDVFVIYLATLYPLIHWHAFSTGKITWFVQGDFFQAELKQLMPICLILYIFSILIWIIKECWFYFKTKAINIPKNLVIAGTLLSWYVGIVAFQADLIFTLLNVVAHGIPYMGLVWIYGEKKQQHRFGMRIFLLFFISLITLAYAEEALWDGFVWQDRETVFPSTPLFHILESNVFQSLIVAFLALPQITHYILDGFIWKFSKSTNRVEVTKA